jgi:hypothetical protein
MPILQLENLRFFLQNLDFFLLRYTREILRFEFLEISSLNVLHRLTYIHCRCELVVVINFSYINNLFAPTINCHKSNN